MTWSESENMTWNKREALWKYRETDRCVPTFSQTNTSLFCFHFLHIHITFHRKDLSRRERKHKIWINSSPFSTWQQKRQCLPICKANGGMKHDTFIHRKQASTSTPYFTLQVSYPTIKPQFLPQTVTYFLNWFTSAHVKLWENHLWFHLYQFL